MAKCAGIGIGMGFMLVATSQFANAHSRDTDAASTACPTAPSTGSAPVCVTTYHNQNTRKGVNYNETILTKANIGANGQHYLTVQTAPVNGQGLILGAGNAVKFAVPTVVNGHVYVGGDGQLAIVSKQ